MPVTEFIKDVDAKKIVIVADFAAPVERVWQVYADPRQLSRVWGPPTHPATVEHHAFVPGGEVHYVMTSPEGEKFYGGWRVVDVDAPRRLEFEDFFADETYAPVPDMPVSNNVFEFTPTGGGTRATYTSTFESAVALQQVIDMGMEEGATSAMGQIDALLAE
jgi:uncharacterized protein YndB with AHSA1/START domain